MTLVARQICLNHPSREAVARCVECTRYFCRECIADHDGRLVCASCLGKVTSARPAAVRTWPRVAAALLKSVLGFIFAWLCFYAVGRGLLDLPSKFHEDTFWNETWSRLHGNSDEP